ncbi:MAG: P-loop NTPase family protein, partial [Planctomycetota bacterium]
MSGEYDMASRSSGEPSQSGRDQAETLRMMVSSPDVRADASERDSGSETPWVVPHRLIVVAGGRPGVGATTITRNLAAGAAHRGVRARYVEPPRALVGTSPDRWQAGTSSGAARPTGSRRGRKAMTRPDFYLLDAGTSVELDGLADYLVLVTSPDAASVKGIYLVLKRFRRSDPDLAAGLVVNRVATP